MLNLAMKIPAVFFVMKYPPVFFGPDGTEIVDATTTSGGLDNVLDNVTKVVTFSGDMLNAMLANPIYAFLFAVSFIGIGVGIVSLFRNAARG